MYKAVTFTDHNSCPYMNFIFSEFLLFLAFFAFFLYQSHNLILGPPETYRGVCAPEGNLLSMSDPPDQTSRSAKIP